MAYWLAGWRVAGLPCRNGVYALCLQVSLFLALAWNVLVLT